MRELVYEVDPAYWLGRALTTKHVLPMLRVRLSEGAVLTEFNLAETMVELQKSVEANALAEPIVTCLTAEEREEFVRGVNDALYWLS